MQKRFLKTFLLLAIFFAVPNFASAIDLTDCGTISATGTYNLQNDVSSDGTCFAIGANDVTLDLGGHTVTYDNATPIAISNGSFENADLSDWDLIAAPVAVRAAGTYNAVTVYSGDYALKIPTPLTQDQSLITASSYAVSANQTYSASVMMWQPYAVEDSQGNTIAANADTHMFIEILDASDDAVLVSTDSRTVQAAYTTRGMQYVSANYTPTSNMSVKIRLRIIGARTVSNVGNAPYGAFYFDDVRLQQTGSRGIAADVGWARRFHFSNGKIIQGQAHGDWSHAIGIGGVSGDDNPSYEIDDMEISVSGSNSKAIQATSIDNASIHNLVIHSAVDTISIRDHYDGALIKIENPSTNGSIHHVTIDSGIQTGIYARSSGAVNRLQIHDNDITLQSKYTNDFAIVSYGVYGSDIYNNTVRCGSGNNTCRGIYLDGNGGTIHGNIVDVHYRPNNQEYNGCGGAAYGIQIDQNTSGVSVYNNDVTANADECNSISLRYSPPETGKPLADLELNNNIYDNTFSGLVVSVGDVIAETVAMEEGYSKHLNFHDNILITNSNFLYTWGVNITATDRSLTMDNNTFQLSYPKANWYHPLASYSQLGGAISARNVTLSNNTYADSTVRADMSTAQFMPSYNGWTVADPGASNLVITEASATDTTAPSAPSGLSVQ